MTPAISVSALTKRYGDIEAVRGATRGVDAVVHLAALASDRWGKGEDVLRVNVEGTWNDMGPGGDGHGKFPGHRNWRMPAPSTSPSGSGATT